MKNIEAMIFDLDGVLIDTETFYIKRLREFAKQEFGLDIPQEEAAVIAGASGPVDWMVLEPYLSSSMDYEEYKRRYRVDLEQMTIHYRELLFPCVPEVLGMLKDKGYRLALATSSLEDKVERVMEECGLAPYFQQRVTRNDVHRPKPDPEIYLVCLDKLRLPAEKCLVVEDSPVGIEAAHRAGITVAARHETRYPLDQSGADYLLESLTDLEVLLEFAFTTASIRS